MKAKLTQNQMLNLVLNDLAKWIDLGGGNSDCSMTFAYNHGYKLHAANLWLGTGAASESVLQQVKGLRISRRKEDAEVKALLKQADVYVCKACNHHAFHEGLEDTKIICTSCDGTARLQRRGSNE